MIEWPPTEKELERIIEIAELIEVPGYNQRSFKGPKGFQVGSFGELIVMDWLAKTGKNWAPVFSTQHDLLVGTERWEIKTKERSVEPQPHYECTVPAYNHEHQVPDRFIFVSVQSDKNTSGAQRFKKAHILGTIRYNDLELKCQLQTPQDAPANNGWVATINCYNVRIDQLDPL